jgi:hypothetical protein
VLVCFSPRVVLMRPRRIMMQILAIKVFPRQRKKKTRSPLLLPVRER